jgi:hypothetical protein
MSKMNAVLGSAIVADGRARVVSLADRPKLTVFSLIDSVCVIEDSAVMQRAVSAALQKEDLLSLRVRFRTR